MQSDLEGVFKWTRKKENNQEDTNGDTFPGISEKIEADMETTTKSPLSLLQLSMRFPSFVSWIVKYNSGIIDICLILSENLPRDVAARQVGQRSVRLLPPSRLCQSSSIRLSEEMQCSSPQSRI